jgi:hypothetical protein
MLPQTEEQLAKAALCKVPADLYTVGARELISRHCRSFLDAMRATPTELLFSAELQKKLENAGTAYSGAVQKVAIAQVSGTKNRDVAGRIKEIFALCDGVRNRTLEAVSAAPVEPLDLARLHDQLASLPAKEEPRLFRLSLMLANPAHANPSKSHCDNGPASRPTRSMFKAVSFRTARRSSGWLTTFTSRQILPDSSTIQTAVSFIAASRPIKCFMLRFLS